MSPERIELHGWDAEAQAWHGPDELALTLRGCRALLHKLREAPGSWYGRLRAQAPGEMPLNLCAAVHDLGDAGLAILDIEGSPGGPLEIILVVPAQRRAKIRQDLAFEFVSFLRFLEGAESVGAEIALHDYVERVLRQDGEPATLIFTIESPSTPADAHLPLSQQAERLAASMIAWMAAKDGSSLEKGAARDERHRCPC